MGKKLTAAQALAQWDAGETVWTIEMGGLGPGYEQCIQLLVFEIIRDHEPLPEGTFGDWGEAAITRCNEGVGGFSGAQVGAAKQLAYRALKFGWDKTINSAPQDRRIQVSKKWPQAHPTPSPEAPGK